MRFSPAFSSVFVQAVLHQEFVGPKSDKLLGDCGEIVATALKLGYRHIDTTSKYRTEQGVGEGIRASGVPREAIFLTTKVSHEHLQDRDGEAVRSQFGSTRRMSP